MINESYSIGKANVYDYRILRQSNDEEVKEIEYDLNCRVVIRCFGCWDLCNISVSVLRVSAIFFLKLFI